MRRFILSSSICAVFACATFAFAGVGTTSAGVTTVDPNNPSTDVQQQSSGFVAANQQAQNAANGGIVLPNGVAGSAQAGQNAAGNAGAGGAKAGESGTAAEHAPPAVPPPPPPPPPTYESRMRPVTPAIVVAPAPTQPAASAAPALKPVHASEKPVDKAQAKPALAPAADQTRAAPVEKKQDEPAPAVTADPGGGRGEAPDGYTFWFGLLIAGALLALAAVTWLRIQRGETLG
ncbi:MAG: hypothetical protein ACREO6_07415 [Rudaea sp.]